MVYVECSYHKLAETDQPERKKSSGLKGSTEEVPRYEHRKQKCGLSEEIHEWMSLLASP